MFSHHNSGLILAASALLHVAFVTAAPRALPLTCSPATADTVVVAIGGDNLDRDMLDSVEVVVNGVHADTRKAPGKLAQFASTISNNTVYVLGGFGGADGDNNFCSYDIVQNKWQDVLLKPPLNLNGHSALELGGKIYLMGGFAGQDFNTKVLTFDIQLSKWDTLDTPNPQTSWDTCTIAQQNHLFYFTGQNLFRSDDGAKTWQKLSSAATSREDPACTALGSDAIIVTGGYDGSAMDFVEIYNITLNKWTLTAAPMLTARAAHSATPMPNGKDVLVCGGHITNTVGQQDSVIDTCEIYDSVANSWTDAGFKLDQARFYYGLYAMQTSAV